jgi:hypothetical protein
MANHTTSSRPGAIKRVEPLIRDRGEGEVVLSS